MWKITESTKKLTTPLCPSSLPHGFLVVSLGRIFTQSGCFASVEVQAKKIAVAVRADLLFVEFVIKTNEALGYTLILKCFSLLTAVVF